MTENKKNKVAVFVCHCGHNIGGVVDVPKVTEAMKENEAVIVSKEHLHWCSAEGQLEIQKVIKETGAEAVVVAACSPRVHEKTFRSTVKEAGLNPYMLEIANIREHASWVHRKDPEGATEKAHDLINMSVAKAKYLEPLEERFVDVENRALVIGGGVAGIQSALDLADAGYPVTLVEKEASIGGKMASFNKVFPTLDCSACILTPKMNDVGLHPNIELLNYSEVTKVEGSIGDFKVTIHKKSTFVDDSLCLACGDCVDVCPIKRVPNAFDNNMSNRRAIYKYFDSAVPNTYVIDAEKCTMIKRGKCGLCAEACEVDAIKFDMEDETIERTIGTIIVATGYDQYRPPEHVLPQYSFGKAPNIITGLDLERMLSANGPTFGKLERPSDGKKPKSIAFILCAGQRDESIGRGYCSRACCMYAIKNSLIIKQKHPEMDVKVFYMDIRAYGKGYDEMYERTREEGVVFVRGKPGAIVPIPDYNDNLMIDYEDTLINSTFMEEFGMVVLNFGMTPTADVNEISQLFGLSRDKYGFFNEAHPKLKPVDSAVDGVFLAGACQYPKDIADSVAQASSAAARAGIPLAQGRLTVNAQIAWIDTDNCSGCGTCVSLCPYGAITFLTKEGINHPVAELNDIQCKGCGTCVSACPTGVITAKGFTDEQLFAQIEASFR